MLLFSVKPPPTMLFRENLLRVTIILRSVYFCVKTSSQAFWKQCMGSNPVWRQGAVAFGRSSLDDLSLVWGWLRQAQLSQVDDPPALLPIKKYSKRFRSLLLQFSSSKSQQLYKWGQLFPEVCQCWFFNL